MIIAEYVGPPDGNLSGERAAIDEGASLFEIMLLLLDYPTVPSLAHWKLYSEAGDNERP